MTVKLIIFIVIAIIVITCFANLNSVSAIVESTSQANKENGNTAIVFSSYNSSIISFSPTLLSATTVSSTEIDLIWTAPANAGGLQLYGYKIERNNGTGFNQIQNTQSTSYQDTGLIPNKQYSYRVYAVNKAGTSEPSNVVTSVTLSSAGTVTGQSAGLSLQEQINQRSIDAQKIHQSLGSNNTIASSPTSNSSTDNQYVNTGNQTVSSTLATPTKIPNWVKAVFGYYAQGNLSDDDLINALQFLIKQGIIKVS
jgi:hypothetical protein